VPVGASTKNLILWTTRPKECAIRPLQILASLTEYIDCRQR